MPPHRTYVLGIFCRSVLFNFMKNGFSSLYIPDTERHCSAHGPFLIPLTIFKVRLSQNIRTVLKMKVAVVFALVTAYVSAFAPAPINSRSSTERAAIFDNIADLDLFAPFADKNDYGARNKKNLKVGKITSKSYVPDGMTAEQYTQIRQKEKAAKDANYARNVRKAGIFEDFTEWYKVRGTNENGNWMNAPNRGHRMAKTKYDYSGEVDDQKNQGGFF